MSHTLMHIGNDSWFIESTHIFSILVLETPNSYNSSLALSILNDVFIILKIVLISDTSVI
jgi:hypothetical protein